jgi:hypothetical protein
MAGIPAENNHRIGKRRRKQNDPEAAIEGSRSLRLPRETILEVPGPPAGNGQQRITRSRLQHPSARRNGNCQRSITKLSFFCYLEWGTVTRGTLPWLPLRKHPA